MSNEENFEEISEKLEETLESREIEVYQIIINEITNDMEFYKTAGPVEKTERLIQNCNANEEEIYKVLKKLEKLNS